MVRYRALNDANVVFYMIFIANSFVQLTALLLLSKLISAGYRFSWRFYLIMNVS